MCSFDLTCLQVAYQIDTLVSKGVYFQWFLLNYKLFRPPDFQKFLELLECDYPCRDFFCSWRRQWLLWRDLTIRARPKLIALALTVGGPVKEMLLTLWALTMGL